MVSCGSGTGGGGGGEPGETDADTTLSLVAFAASEPGWATVEPVFAESPDGDGVAVEASYGPSGEQSRSVADGEPADVVSFSVEPDITRLVDSGKVDENWDAGVTRGIPFGSVVSFAVRPGNPKNIRDWNDLLRPGVEVITPSPLRSGAAKWNLLAAYAWASNGGQDAPAGRDFVGELVSGHVRERPGSARAATDLFTGGTGDVLLGPESEALDLGLDLVIPPQTIKVENPVAVVSASRHLEQAIDFVNFQFTPTAQKRPRAGISSVSWSPVMSGSGRARRVRPPTCSPAAPVMCCWVPRARRSTSASTSSSRRRRSRSRTRWRWSAPADISSRPSIS